MFLPEDQEICMHYGDELNPFSEAVVPPTFSNTLFVFPSFEKLVEAENQPQQHYVYSRGTNPTVESAERKLAALERGEQCKCFASGMAAISAAIFNSVQKGDHVLCISNVYKSTLDVLTYLQKFGVDHSTVNSTSMEEIEKAIQPNTKLFYLECPTDLNFRLLDLKGVADLAKSKGIRTIIDNTWATPLLQKPLTYGMDIVVHSASKYLGGHGDLMGGAVITSKKIMKELFEKEFLLIGGIMAPREASLLLRGLRTLPLRMKAHQENAFKVASFLESHPSVTKVNYPGLPSHPDYQLGQKQLLGYSGLMTFELKEASFQAVARVINKMKIFKIGVSWGAFESIVISPNYGDNVQELTDKHVNLGMIRISVGLEDIEKIIEDLNQALS
jgi:cystathionine beta-lyase/cystathionine gamma-synthase